MTVELDADELKLHDYQFEHFSEILPFILRHIMPYGAAAGALLSGIFYLLTFQIFPPDPLLTLIVHPLPPWYEILFNYVIRSIAGAIVGGVMAFAVGTVFTDLIQFTCRKRVSIDYVERYDLSLPFMFYQIGLPIPVMFLILFFEAPILWYTRQHLLFAIGSYLTVYWVLSSITRRFLKWYIPPLLPPLE